MEGTGVVDRFLEVFTRYIDSGFGLLQGEVAWLASTLIVIDVTLAALFWAWGADDDIMARLVKKILFVGIFAFIIGNWNALSQIVFESFAGLGLKATGGSMSASEFLRPGHVAQVGLDAGRPILESISGLMGYIAFFENFIQIVVLLFSWLIVLLSFFILSIQLFIALIEFKLATLCGFVLVPFALFNKTAFMAERVLGLVISSGVKILVLAVIIGIGSTLFGEFTQGFAAQPTIEDAMAIVLAALCLLGLGIFAPGIANGIVSGGPQLGAGAAVGTGLAAGGVVVAGAAGAKLTGGTAVSAVRSGASVAGGASKAYREGSAASGGSVAGGLANVAKTGASAVTSPLRGSTAKSATPGGASAAADSAKTAKPESQPGDTGSSEPGWARAMRRRQSASHGVQTAAHALRSGDAGGAGTSVNVKDDS